MLASCAHGRSSLQSREGRSNAQACSALPAQAAEARAAHLREAHLGHHPRPVRVGEGPPERMQRRHCACAPEAQHSQLAHLHTRRVGLAISTKTPTQAKDGVVPQLTEKGCASENVQLSLLSRLGCRFAAEHLFCIHF